MTESLIVSEYHKAFGNLPLRHIRGPQFRKQRQAFLSAVNGSKVKAKDAGMACVEAVLYFNLPCGFGTECYAVVERNLERILG
jgi:hypothetical protein